MSKIRCGCTKCEFNNNRECQADDVEIKSQREDRGDGITCGSFRRKQDI
ncbi:MAG TPA: DUF1540 domain-containing protein [Syntrophomonadaceae bacterium]|nr:DUF1540 domain-containing protein [Syntrophomonadaceae bacterium]